MLQQGIVRIEVTARAMGWGRSKHIGGSKKLVDKYSIHTLYRSNTKYKESIES